MFSELTRLAREVQELDIVKVIEGGLALYFLYVIVKAMLGL